MLKVSVIVPVYNTGRYIEECAPSLLDQSLPADEYEVIYVDDGSTDDTLSRLRKLAAEHPNVSVHTQPNSGWPGKPRNVGMKHARGEYLQFVDHDDTLGPEALERLYEHAKRNRADVVLGKMSSTMVRPRRLFRHTVDACTIDNDELMQSMSPHKMLRRAFVEKHGLQFPEGPWILEDLLFVSAAYLVAERIAVLGDYPCYYWMKRDDGGNNTAARFSERHDFFGNVRRVVRQIKAGTEPGEGVDDLQNRLLHRNYHVEVLSRAREPEILNVAPQEQRPRFEAARRVALEEFPPAVREGLPAVSRVRAELLERGDFEGALELAKRTREIKARTKVTDLRWQAGRLVADVTLDLVRGDGEPLALVERDGRLLLDPELLDGVPGFAQWEVPDPLRLAYAELVVKDRDREDWWYPEGDLEVRLEPLDEGRVQVLAAGRMCVDPATLAGGRPLQRGVHDVWAFVQLLGVDRLVRLTGDGTPGTTTDAGPALLGTTGATAEAGAALGGARIAIPYWTGAGQLALDMDERQRRLADDLGRVTNAVRGRGGVLPLPLASQGGGAGAASAPVRVRIGEGKSATTVAAELVAGQPPLLRVTGRIKAPAGRWPVALLTSGVPKPSDAGPVAYAVVRDGRVVRLEGPAYRAPAQLRLRDAVAGNPWIRRARRALGLKR
ncbi:glycosyltransferase family 2 protein [Actinacidiphila soli]|uniref:glycosyltransferase family 2 protein n=1 Tax=Actinacidiphila soli TaxID=2487275 RepID=UPI000FCABBEB|nr:glycosyltransferase family 2 protein [Actinacidiphila soli]